MQEQEHLSHVYQKLVEIREDLDTTLNTTQKDAARDLRQMSEEIRPDFGGADETIETLAAIETLNSVIFQKDLNVVRSSRHLQEVGKPG